MSDLPYNVQRKIEHLIEICVENQCNLGDYVCVLPTNDKQLAECLIDMGLTLKKSEAFTYMGIAIYNSPKLNAPLITTVKDYKTNYM